MLGDKELLVTEVTVDYGYSDTTSGWGDWSSATFTVTGIMPRLEVDMNGTNRAQKYREDAQGEDFAELRKAGLLDRDGTLSRDGQDLLLEILADKHKAELVKFAKTINE